VRHIEPDKISILVGEINKWLNSLEEEEVYQSYYESQNCPKCGHKLTKYELEGIYISDKDLIKRDCDSCDAT
jgi:hypothetical protein